MADKGAVGEEPPRASGVEPRESAAASEDAGDGAPQNGHSGPLALRPRELTAERLNLATVDQLLADAEAWFKDTCDEVAEADTDLEKAAQELEKFDERLQTRTSLANTAATFSTVAVAVVASISPLAGALLGVIPAAATAYGYLAPILFRRSRADLRDRERGARKLLEARNEHKAEVARLVGGLRQRRQLEERKERAPPNGTRRSARGTKRPPRQKR